MSGSTPSPEAQRFLVEYTQGRGTRSRFEMVTADTAAQAGEDFLDTTSGTYLRNVWVTAAGWELGTWRPAVVVEKGQA